ncbi:MAG: helix-turn-helix domain-containing protein [Opitutaceae bacterium]|jgi:transcriptional regulator with XRE-family HTH domain|nr:helix-turn-helix domain-containing protein [Opitutaceae bacterium]
MPTESQARQLSKFGANVRRERWRRGITQESLAERVDVHPRMIQKIEAGQTNLLLTTLLRIQAALDCPWDLLLSGFGPAEKTEAWMARMKQENGAGWDEFMNAVMLGWAIAHGKPAKREKKTAGAKTRQGKRPAHER